MSFTYNLSDSIGQVRLLVTDTNVMSYIFEDAEVTAFLGMEGGTVKRAAALALETIARNEIMVLKVIRLLDLQTDGASTAREMRMQAEKLRDQADKEAENADFASGGMIDIAQMVIDPFQWDDYLLGVTGSVI